MAVMRSTTKRVSAALRDPAKLTTFAADYAGRAIERVFIPIDRRLMRRNRNLSTVPWRTDRRGGKISYGEWAWVIGLMQSLIATHVPDRADLRIVDVGCGTGLVGLAALPSLGPLGHCLGLDVMPENVEFCRKQHADPRLSFELLSVPNAAYAPEHEPASLTWPVDLGSQDLVTALSVWTHLDPDMAEQSLAEVERVLRPGGKAIISFFIRDDENTEQPPTSAYHRTRPEEWVFDRPVAAGWWTPAWTRVPEQAIAIDRSHLDQLVSDTGLTVDRTHAGYWREKPGLYFQDIVVLTKPA